MKYYKLYCETPEDENGGYAEIVDQPVEGIVSWISGEKFDVLISDTLQFDVEPEDDYQGLPPELFLGATFLMSDRLVKALQSAGVNNLDCYPAILTNVDSGDKYHYHAVNIIGVVAAANLDESVWENYDGEAEIDTFFDKLVIDETKGLGLLLFRLAESLGTIIIHEKVKDNILSNGIDTLTFLPTD